MDRTQLAFASTGSVADTSLEGVDPVLSANIYCNRRLDTLLQRAIAPYVRELKSSFPQALVTLCRYGKCGEHLKVWVFGPEEIREPGRALLAERVADFFASADSDPGSDDPWISKAGLPPMDDLDDADEDYPNKTILFSKSRRSPALFGCDLYSADETHVRLFAETQDAVAGIVLERLQQSHGSDEFYRGRQSLFIKVLISALAAMQVDKAAMVEYLTYHRNWLIRTVARFAPAETTEDTIRGEFEQRVLKQSAAVAGLSKHLEYAAQGQVQDLDPLLGEWRRKLARFCEYVRGYRGRPEYDQDPFTTDFSHLAIFKVLHSAANQFGLRLSLEAYVHHLLLSAALQQREA